MCYCLGSCSQVACEYFCHDLAATVILAVTHLPSSATVQAGYNGYMCYLPAGEAAHDSYGGAWRADDDLVCRAAACGVVDGAPQVAVH
jgi:hypothetical protein